MRSSDGSFVFEEKKMLASVYLEIWIELKILAIRLMGSHTL